MLDDGHGDLRYVKDALRDRSEQRAAQGAQATRAHDDGVAAVAFGHVDERRGRFAGTDLALEGNGRGVEEPVSARNPTAPLTRSSTSALGGNTIS
jgi:hypothetical protein